MEESLGMNLSQSRRELIENQVEEIKAGFGGMELFRDGTDRKIAFWLKNRNISFTYLAGVFTATSDQLDAPMTIGEGGINRDLARIEYEFMLSKKRKLQSELNAVSAHLDSVGSTSALMGSANTPSGSTDTPSGSNINIPMLKIPAPAAVNPAVNTPRPIDVKKKGTTIGREAEIFEYSMTHSVAVCAGHFGFSTSAIYNAIRRYHNMV